MSMFAPFILVCVLLVLIVLLFRMRSPGREEEILSPLLFVDQLGKNSKDSWVVVKSFPIYDIPSSGISISRPDAQYGDIILDSRSPSAYTVSECHLFVGQDEEGFFAVDKGSRNGTYLLHSSTRVTSISLCDQQVVYLGEQALRFRIPHAAAPAGVGNVTRLCTGSHRSDKPDPLSRY